MSSSSGSFGRSVLEKMGLVGISVVLALGVAELVTRLVGVDLNPSPRLRYHPVLGWTAEAGWQGFDNVNSRGFRHQVSPENPEERRRLVILGDSFSFGGVYPFAQTYAGRLEHWLSGIPTTDGDSPRRPWDVVNLAARGFGTAQELLALRQYGLEFEPDAVVLQMFPYNDLCDNNIRQAFTCGFLDGHRPYFEVEGERLRLTHLSPLRARLRRWSRLFGLLESRRRWGFPDSWRQLPRVGTVFRRPGPSGARRFEPREGLLLLGEAYHAGLAFQSNLYSLVPRAHQPAIIRSGWEVTEALVGEIAKLLDEREVPLIGVVIPYVETFEADWPRRKRRRTARPSRASSTGNERPWGYRRLVAEHGTARAEGILADAGARVISMRQRVLEAGEDPRAFFFPTQNNRHINDRGHYLIATAILHELETLGLADRPAPVAPQNSSGSERDGFAPAELGRQPL